MKVLHIQQRPEIPEDCKGFVIEANGKFYVGITEYRVETVRDYVWTGLFSRLCLVSYRVTRGDVTFIHRDYRHWIEAYGGRFTFRKAFVPDDLMGYKTRGEAERAALQAEDHVHLIREEE